MTQETISQKLRMSRARVSRLMQEAVETGIVKITIAQDPGTFAELERQLEIKYGLLEVVISAISNPDSPELVAKELGPAAAAYFSRIVQDHDKVGLTWGTTLAAMVENLRTEKKNNVSVIQMAGGLGSPSSATHATGLISRIAMAINGFPYLMPAPGVVASIEVANLLRADPAIALALEKTREINVAFVGIGAPLKDSFLMRDESIISFHELETVTNHGAVGVISLNFFDIDGNKIPSDVNNRVIGIQLEDIHNINRVVGVAGGTDKYGGILGAIRGQHINTLITDEHTALRLAEDTP